MQAGWMIVRTEGCNTTVVSQPSVRTLSLSLSGIFIAVGAIEAVKLAAMV